MRLLRLGFYIGILCQSIAMMSIAIAGYVMDRGHEPAQVAVVLGTTVHENGNPSWWLRARLDRAYALYQTGRVRQIVTSGGIGHEGHDEAKVMAQYLQQRGVSEEALIVDSKGYNTLATAQFAAQRFSPQTRIIVVSQFFHVPRIYYTFKKAGFEDVQGASVGYLGLRDVYSLAREVPAFAVYFCCRQP